MGAEVDLPSYEEAVAAFDEALMAEPKRMSPEEHAKHRERQEWLQVMGLGGGE